MEFCAELAQQFGTLRRTLIVGGVNGIATGMLRCRDAASALAMRLTDVLCSTRPVKGLPSSVTFRPVDHTALAAAVERLGAHETMVIRPEQSERLQSEFGITAKELLVALLRLVRHHAIPPISNFKVGAAGLGASGAIYFGVNLEFPNDRIGHTVCLAGRARTCGAATAAGSTRPTSLGLGLPTDPLHFAEFGRRMRVQNFH